MYESILGNLDQNQPTPSRNRLRVQSIRTVRSPVLDPWAEGANVAWDYKPIPALQDDFGTEWTGYTGKAE